MLCPRCGTPNRANAERCVRCQTVLERTGANMPGAAETAIDAVQKRRDPDAPRARPSRPPPQRSVARDAWDTEPLPTQQARSARPARADQSATQPLPDSQRPTDRPVPQAPSTLRPTPAAGKIPSLSQVANRGQSLDAPRPSPWEKERREGGALAGALLDILGDEETVLEQPRRPPVKAKLPPFAPTPSQPPIADVGFKGPAAVGGGEHARGATEQIPASGVVKRRPERAPPTPEQTRDWQDVIDAATPVADARFRGPPPSAASSRAHPSDATTDAQEITQPVKTMAPARERSSQRSATRAQRPLPSFSSPPAPAPARTVRPAKLPPPDADLLENARVALPPEPPTLEPRSMEGMGAGDITRYAPGELAGAPAPKPSKSGPSIPEGATIAAPGALAGMLAATEAEPSRAPKVAPPEDLAGLVSDLDDLVGTGRARPAKKKPPPPQETVRFAEPEPKGARGAAPAAPARKPPPPPEPTDRGPAPLLAQAETKAFLDPVADLAPPAPTNLLVSPPVQSPPARRGDSLDQAHTRRLPPLEEVLAEQPEVALAEGVVSLELASMLRRIGAVAVDAVLLLVILFVVAAVGGFGEGVQSASLLDPDDVSTLLVTGDLNAMILSASALVFIVSLLGHAAIGRTLGKLVFGLELVDAKTGSRPGVGRVAARAFLSLFGLFAGGAGYLWLVVDRQARGLHDVVCRTRVVRSASRKEQPPVLPSFVANEPTL